MLRCVGHCRCNASNRLGHGVSSSLICISDGKWDDARCIETAGHPCDVYRRAGLDVARRLKGDRGVFCAIK